MAEERTQRKIILTDADDFPLEPQTERQALGSQINSKTELESLWLALSKLGKHFVITLAVSGLGVLTHLALVHLFGDPKFFDSVPIRYAIDAGDIAVIVTFFVIMIRELWKQEE